MVKVYAAIPGLEIRIGPFGVATEVEAVIVPPEVAAELRAHPQLRLVEDPPPEPPKKVKAKKDREE